MKQDQPFFNIAHRGARAFAPENTLPAVRTAQRLGANAVELDVQMSRDGELVVFHDDSVIRCSDGLHKFPDRTDYSVSAFTWEELSLLDVGTWYVHELAKPRSARQRYLQDLTAEEVEQGIPPGDADEYESGSVRIPRLRDALAVAHECQLAVVLDVKTIPRRRPTIAGKTVALIRELGLEPATMISSFDHVLLADVRQSDATIATGVLTSERLYRVREYVQTLDADAFHPAIDVIDADAIGELTRAGLLVNVWTENSAPRIPALIDAGVTGIFTDYPNRLARVLTEIGRRAPVPAPMRRSRSGRT